VLNTNGSFGKAKRSRDVPPGSCAAQRYAYIWPLVGDTSTLVAR